MRGVMPRGTRQLLLPAKPSFIWLSLLSAFALNILENYLLGGWVSWAPDFLALTLAFWSLHQPQRIGMSAAFAFGLAMDVHQTTLLGQHALCYTLVCFAMFSLHRRVMWFKPAAQALQLLPLFAAMHLLELSLRLLFGSAWPHWQLIFAPLLEMIFWPVATFLLLIPQRRSPDPDANRPL
jgi:rod shape-determining protein MreD